MKLFTEPELKVTVFSIEDMITASSTDGLFDPEETRVLEDL